MKPTLTLTVTLLAALTAMFAAEEVPRFVAKQQAVQILAASAETPDLRAVSIPAVTMTAVYHGDEAKISAPQETSAK